jgi:hypothetical protein
MMLMFPHRRALAGAAVALLAALACSDAPVVPVQPTSRNVLAEVTFVDTT